jgi:predicted NUDIX family NTP pyrophosphohydrolase
LTEAALAASGLLDGGGRLLDGLAPAQPRSSLRAQHMAKRSAGLLMYRWKDRQPELFLVHPGGPFWARKDAGAWSIPKGLYEEGEDPLAAAKREFEEETGCMPRGRFFELGAFKQPSGKQIFAWAVEGDCDLSNFKSNLFAMEWPPKSGRMQDFPEVDRAAWFRPHQAMRKIVRGQLPILTALLERLGCEPAADAQQS